MAHLYAKAPPAFAKDPWAWDYTRDRIEGTTGVPYDQWVGKHFAGAAAMYKNVVKKYGASMASGTMTAPKVCVDCGKVAQHFEGDYICAACRDAIEAAPDFKAAAATITNPDALDAIRESLYEKLGHAAKDAKKGISPAARTRPTFPVADPAAPPLDEPAPATAGKVSRNYARMSEEKLARSVKELEAGQGEAITKLKGEDALDHLEAALRVAQERGIAV